MSPHAKTAPWIWSKRVDLGVFAGSAGLACAVAALSPWLSVDGTTPLWLWFVFVLGLDVAHVWSTIFRTYLDRDELRRHRWRYAGLPVLCYAAGVALHLQGPLTFWRVLAYVAVFHFIRQQVGWVAIYRVRNGERERLDAWLDAAVVYGSTAGPVLWWHAHLPRQFSWFVPGDFVDLAALRPWLPLFGWLYLGLLAAYGIRSVRLYRRGHAVNVGKHVVVGSTMVIWWGGIVLSNQDFTFTITNVTIHAIPYFALLWFYASERAVEQPGGTIARIVGYGLGAFLFVLLALAFTEELLWERLVWHDRPGWFGGPPREEPLLSELALAFVVPLLSLPQTVHYALDGILWKGRHHGAAQARALGFLPRRADGPRWAPAPREV